MEIIKKKDFFDSLYNILEYISKDSISRWLKFADDLDEKINSLYLNPYMFRKSIYFDNEDIRDLIFKWYVIPYKIEEKNNKIIILWITKYRSYL
jgi:plasmid stabilization system protein ParE